MSYRGMILARGLGHALVLHTKACRLTKRASVRHWKHPVVEMVHLRRGQLTALIQEMRARA